MKFLRSFVKNEPDIQVVDSVSRSLASSMLNVDGLNDSSSGILDPEVPDSLKVVNLFETDAWTQAVYRVADGMRRDISERSTHLPGERNRPAESGEGLCVCDDAEPG